MNKFATSFVLLVIVALASAAPSVGPVERSADELAALRALPALEHEEVHDEFGQYSLRYVTAEGIVVSESGRLVPDLEGDGYVMIIEGETSYIGEDGKVYVTKYTAGLDGAHFEGNHLPVAPKLVVSESELAKITKPELISTVTIEAIPDTIPTPMSDILAIVK